MKLSQPIYINDFTVLITCANSTRQADLIAINLWCCWEEVWQVLSEMTFRPCKTMMGFLIGRILWYVVRIWSLMPETILEAHIHYGVTVCAIMCISRKCKMGIWLSAGIYLVGGCIKHLYIGCMDYESRK